MPRDISSNTASTRAELAALASTLEQCRDRISALAETRAMAVRYPNNADSGDDLLTAIYEAERGLNSSIRLVQRAAKQGRV